MASILSTVHRGTAFEKRSLRLLEKHLSMSLQRVGGKSDGGIDLQGWWWLPAPSSSYASNHKPDSRDAPSIHDVERRRIRVLAQCKATATKLSPNVVRELEGVLFRFMLQRSGGTRSLFGTLPTKLDPDSSNSLGTDLSSPLVAMLISQAPFTRSTILRAMSSPVPFFLLHLPAINLISPEENDYVAEALTEGDIIGAAIWNKALHGADGLLHGEIEARWERNLVGGGRPGLWCRGHRIESWVPPALATTTTE